MGLPVRETALAGRIVRIGRVQVVQQIPEPGDEPVRGVRCGLEERAEQPAKLLVAGACVVEEGAPFAWLAGEGFAADARKGFPVDHAAHANS